MLSFFCFGAVFFLSGFGSYEKQEDVTSVCLLRVFSLLWLLNFLYGSYAVVTVSMWNVMDTINCFSCVFYLAVYSACLCGGLTWAVCPCIETLSNRDRNGLKYYTSRRLLRATTKHTEHMKCHRPGIPLFIPPLLSFLLAVILSLCFFHAKGGEAKREITAHLPPGEGKKRGLLRKF